MLLWFESQMVLPEMAPLPLKALLSYFLQPMKALVSDCLELCRTLSPVLSLVVVQRFDGVESCFWLFFCILDLGCGLTRFSRSLVKAKKELLSPRFALLFRFVLELVVGVHELSVLLACRVV